MAGIFGSHHNLMGDAESEGELVRKRFERFLHEYSELVIESGREEKYYHNEARKMQMNKRTTMNVNFKHLIKNNSIELVDAIHNEYFKLEPFLRQAVKNFMTELYKDFAKDQSFHIGFFNLMQVEGIRDMRTSRLGKLCALKGTVTKATEVRPELLVGVFICENCKAQTGPVEQQFSYTLPRACPNKMCTNKTRFELLKEGSLYVDWQKIRIQELDSDLPAGATPRSLEVVLRHEQVEAAQPGDRAVIVGTLIVVPEGFSMFKPGEKYEVSRGGAGQRVPGQRNMEGVTGLKSLGVRDINYKLLFLANQVQVNDSRLGSDVLEHAQSAKGEDPNDRFGDMTESEKNEILAISKDPDVLDKLASLIAPSVYSNKEIKKGILLMLFSGVNKRTEEGMKLRGDLNVCIVGDPATAKSQFLKFIHKFVPRTVYTSGKGSTAAGLTAALSRDPETGEFTIEAGALILADNGICCIDEFDKMEEKDVVAIHEAMEQQTISLTKAGIQATLNARCSILAAANPIFGRYDKTKTLRANIKLAPPLMSRFDLFFVVTDECDEKKDLILAQHLLHIHRNVNSKSPEELLRPTEPTGGVFTQIALQRYLRYAKRLTPRITPGAAMLLERGYLRIRSNELSIQKSAYRVTVRQLESLIRLSEAIAKVHFSSLVLDKHVKMAFDLFSQSMISVHLPDIMMEEEELPPQPRESSSQLPAALAEHEQLMQQRASQQEGMAAVEETQPPEKKKKTVSLSHDEYERISKALIRIVKSNGQAVTRNSLVELLLSSDMMKIQTIDEFNRYTRLVNVIIKRMISHDKIFTISSADEADPAAVISLHSQYFNSLE